MPALWMRCPSCEGWLCLIHGEHVHDCACPPIEDWANAGIDPYAAWARTTAKREAILERVLTNRPAPGV